MPLGKIRRDYVALPTTRPMSHLTGNIDGVAAKPSPARALQEQLERHAREAAHPDLQKWSPRRSLAFIVASSMALWLAILVAGAEVIRLIA